MMETRNDDDNNVGNEGDVLSLIVKSSERKEIIEVTENSSIFNFKQIIARKLDVDVQSFRLIYAGRILKDTDTIKALNIKSGYTVYLVIKPSTPTASTLHNNTLFTVDNEENIYRNLFEQYIYSPDILRSLLTNNPSVQRLIERDPEIAHILNNPTLLREVVQMMRNPNLANEFIRNSDRAVSNLESLPGGFNALQRMYHNIVEPFTSATSESENPFADLLSSTTSSQQGTENRNPLPNPWSLNEVANNEASNDILTSNPLLQNVLGQGQLQNDFAENVSPQMLQNLQGLLSNITSDDLVSMQQLANDALTHLSPQNTSEPTDTGNLSPDIISALLPAILHAGTVLNQPPDLSNNNVTNGNSILQLLSQPHTQDRINNSVNLEENYRTQMQQLAEMGFLNEEANLQALIASFGDLNRAIEVLLSGNLAD